MNKPQISYVMPQTDLDAIKTALALIVAKMPFLISLKPGEISALIKQGEKSVDFAQDAFLASQHFPNALPPIFDKVEYAKDTALFKNMSEIKMLIDSLHERVNSTYLAVGSESMTTSLIVYELLQSASKTTPGLKSVVEQLGKRFKKQGRKASKTTPSNSPDKA